MTAAGAGDCGMRSRLRQRSGRLARGWFDPKRLRGDYEPTGWKGPPGVTHRAIPGHDFPLDLSDDDKRA
jgi:hypothetical protein